MGLINRPTRQNRRRRALGSLAVLLTSSILGAIAFAQSGNIEFEVLPAPANLNISDSRSDSVIRSAGEWRTWLIRLPDMVENLPTVDFDKYTLLVVNAGYRTKGPFVITFDSVTDVGNEIRVHISVKLPASCPPVPESAHYTAMAVIPHTDKPIQFDVSNTNSGCHHQ